MYRPAYDLPTVTSFLHNVNFFSQFTSFIILLAAEIYYVSMAPTQGRSWIGGGGGGAGVKTNCRENEEV